MGRSLRWALCYKMPTEIVPHILSYLHVFDFFLLKLANRYMHSVVNSFPRLTYTKYVAALEAEDRRRSGIGQSGRSALAIAASRGQEALVMRFKENDLKAYHFRKGYR